MRVIVCGSAPRVDPAAGKPGWTDTELLYATLDRFDRAYGPLTIIEGEAPGADVMAREWARSRGRDCEPFHANWSRGRSAGPQRNRRMLGADPDLVFAFSVDWPLTGGTANMVEQARNAGLPVVAVTPDGVHRPFDPVAA